MAELQRLHVAASMRPAIVLIHGLGGDFIDTWRHVSRTRDDCWPHWLGKDIDCDVWSVGYDADLSAWQGQAMPLPDQGDQVADLLATESDLKGKGLVLIGHSLGGLVIKDLGNKWADQGRQAHRGVSETNTSGCISRNTSHRFATGNSREGSAMGTTHE